MKKSPKNQKTHILVMTRGRNSKFGDKSQGMVTETTMQRTAFILCQIYDSCLRWDLVTTHLLANKVWRTQAMT